MPTTDSGPRRRSDRAPSPLLRYNTSATGFVGQTRMIAALRVIYATARHGAGHPRGEVAPAADAALVRATLDAARGPRFLELGARRALIRFWIRSRRAPARLPESAPDRRRRGKVPAYRAAAIGRARRDGGHSST